METNTEIVDYKKRMDNFPCAFNLTGTDKLTTARLKAVQHNLGSELDINDGCDNELIIKRNLLTWVLFLLEKRDEALLLNSQVIESTKSSNIASLANRTFIVWLMKDDVQALTSLEDLEKMKSGKKFQTYFTDAKAEQAYYYSRLGGLNLQRAITSFCALPQTPINYLRRFGLGQAYRRMAHINIVCSSSEHLTVTDYHKMAAECLFDVAENADDRLSSQAYAQLVSLRRFYPFKLTPAEEEMFHGLGVEELCSRALKHGMNIPSVLVQCGKALKTFNLDKSIELLETSIAIKEDSTAYHHLGICYRRRAEMLLKRHRNRSKGLNRQTKVGPQKVDRQIQGQSKDVSKTSGNKHSRLADKRTVNQPMSRDEMDLELPEIDNASRDSGSSRYSDGNIRFTRGSTQSIGVKHRSAVGTGLAQGNTQINGWKTKTFLECSVKKYKNVLPLNKDDMYVQKARTCLEKAVELANENLPAVLDLGILLKDTDQMNDALKQFNNITNSGNLSITNRVSVITAYEHAGLCYLQLYNDSEKKEYLEMGKNRLTKGVSIAADLIHSLPELQGSHKEVWQAFTTLLTVNDGEHIPDSHRLKRKIKILELAREHGDIIDVIQKLKDTGHKELANPNIVKAALDSYLQVRQPENALVYHNIVAMNPSAKDSDWWNAGPMLSLRVKVLLHAIAGRLKNTDDNDNAAMLFQQLFDLIFGSCVGLRDPENDQQTVLTSVVSGDVLFIFESDECPDEENCKPTVKTARCLKRLTSCLFGLVTTENVKGTGEYGCDRAMIQLNEMLKYQTVIIVIGKETRDRYFDAMLKSVPHNRNKAPPRQKILVINTGPENDNIPVYLKQYKSLKLQDIGILGDPQRIPQTWNDTDPIPYTDIIRDVFGGDVDAILKLFCFMIEQTWPCP